MELTKRYGFVREEESDLIDKVLFELEKKFHEVRFLEIGVFGGGTVTGVVNRCRDRGLTLFASGVDFAQWRPSPDPLPNYDFHAGDSMDMWREITGKYNFLFVDGCHCVVHASQDFLNYSPFVVVGGYILLHDTAIPTDLGKDKQEEWPQDHSYAGKPPSSLGVREALKKLGLLDGRRTDFEFVEEIESPTGLMGMMLYRRVLPYE